MLVCVGMEKKFAQPKRDRNGLNTAQHKTGFYAISGHWLLLLLQCTALHTTAQQSLRSAITTSRA